jgi:hypothetical protein
MNTRTIVATLLSIFVLGLAGLALGGFDPTPFHQLINELDSVENVLDAQDDQLKEVLSAPPDPYKTKSLVNKLNSMAGTLVNQNERVSAVLASPPDDMTPPPEFIAALVDVRDEANSIVVRAEEGFGSQPNDQRVLDALADVGSAAWGIVFTVDEYLAGQAPSDPI